MCYKTLPSGYVMAIAIMNTHQLWLKHKTHRKEEKGGREEGREGRRALKQDGD